MRKETQNRAGGADDQNIFFVIVVCDVMHGAVRFPIEQPVYVTGFQHIRKEALKHPGVIQNVCILQATKCVKKL